MNMVRELRIKKGIQAKQLALTCEILAYPLPNTCLDLHVAMRCRTVALRQPYKHIAAALLFDAPDAISEPGHRLLLFDRIADVIN